MAMPDGKIRKNDKHWKYCTIFPTYRLIIPNSIHLSEEHNCSEDGKQQTFKDEEEQKDDCGRWGERRTLPPFTFDAYNKLIDTQEQTVEA